MPSREDNVALARDIMHAFGVDDILLKVGLRSFIRDGDCIVRPLKSMGFGVFLDLKLYDIPNTMIDSVLECDRLGVDMLTVHASSGEVAMRGVALELRRLDSSMKVVAVSALTSFDEDSFRQVYNMSVGDGVRNLAGLAYSSGLYGLVCSCMELGIVREISSSLYTVVPGIRLDSRFQDQKRVGNVHTAKSLGADLVVVGRPIYESDDKIVAIKSLLDLM